MTASDNKELLRRAAQEFNNVADRSGWFDIHADSVRAHGLAPTLLDKAGLKGFYAALWAGFPDLKIHVEELVAEGDRVVWRIKAEGTHDGPFLGVQATGTSAEFGAHYSFRFEKGQIVERWTTLDRLGLLVQIGAAALPTKK
jgi:predicted ester cyclase